jgi:hypothetical protein
MQHNNEYIIITDADEVIIDEKLVRSMSSG